MNRTSKLTIALGTGLASVAAAGVAVASFGATGGATGSSGGHSVAKQDLGVTVTAPSGLYPTEGVAPDTATPGNIVATVTNSNPYNVTLSSASVTGVTSTVAGCSPALADFTFGTPSYSNSGVVKGKAQNGGTAGTGTATIAITSVANTLSDNCANADLSFAVTVGGASS